MKPILSGFEALYPPPEAVDELPLPADELEEEEEEPHPAAARARATVAERTLR
jgi:hypothetical protein